MRAELKKRGLDTKGKQAELEARLVEAESGGSGRLLQRRGRKLARANRASSLFFVLIGSELSSLPPIFFSGRSS